MESIVSFRHCGKLIYTFTDRGESPSSSECQLGATRSGPGVPGVGCPLCGSPLSFRLLDAPVAVACPFRNGHATPCAFLLSSRSGPTSLSEQNDLELHVGISNSEGVVFSYTESGVQLQGAGWEHSLAIPLISNSNHTSAALVTPSSHSSAALATPSNPTSPAKVTPRNNPPPAMVSPGNFPPTAIVTPSNCPPPAIVSPSNHSPSAMVSPSNHPPPPLLPGSIVRSWDQLLETFSAQDRWTPDRFSEEGEFGSCCYGFALSFINEVRRSEVMEIISQNTFTLRYVLPTVDRSSKYLSLYNYILHHGYYCSTIP